MATVFTVTLEMFVSGAWLDITRLNARTRLLVDSDGGNCITITRGASDDQGAIPPTSVTGMRYLDRDNTLDGENYLSPYYRLIGASTPVRISVDGNVRAEIELASLHTTSEQTADGDEIVEHEIALAGQRLRLEGAHKAVVSAATRYYSRTVPWQWWAMESGGGVQVLEVPSSIPIRRPDVLEARTDLQALRASPASAGGSENARLSGVVSGDTTTGPPGAAGAVNLTGGGQLAAVFPSTGPSLGLDTLVVEGWFQFSTPVETTGAGQIVRIHLTAETVIGVFAQPASVTGPLVFELSSTSEAISLQNNSVTPDDGAWHHLIMSFTRVTGTTFDYDIYYDGQGYFFGTTTATALLDLTEFVVSPTGELGAASQWAIWKDGYEVTTLLGGYNAGSGFAGYTPDGVISQLFGDYGIETSTADDFDVFTETIEITGIKAGALMEQVDQAAAAGQVLVIEKRDEHDEMRRIPRTVLYNQVPTATIAYPQLVGKLEPITDSYDGRIVNQWTMTNDSGDSETYAIPDDDPYRWTTQDPPTGAGVRDRGESFPVTAGNLRSLAAWYAHVNAWRERRYVEVKVALHKHVDDYPNSGFSTAEIAALRALDIGKALYVDTTDAPSNVPYNEIRLLVRGYTERISKFINEITFNSMPADIWEVEVTEFGPTAKLANVIDADDTTVRVAPGDGPTPSVIEDYHISINGDPMTVTFATVATPAYINSGAAAYADNASVAPALPAGITADAGQLLLIFAAAFGTGAADPVCPGGWEELVVPTSGEIKLFGKYYVTGDVAPTVTMTGGAAGTTLGAQMAAFSGLSMTLDKNTQVANSEFGAFGQQNASAANIAYPALTGRRGSSAMFILAKRNDDWTGVATPGSMTEVGDSSSTLGNDMGLAWYFQATAGVAPTLTAGSLTVSGGAAATSQAAAVSLRALMTYTVTRAIAGPGTSHTPGQEVHIWRPGAVAL